MKIRTLIVPLVAVAALAGGWAVQQRLTGEFDASVSPEPGLAITLPDVDGMQHSIEEWRGKILVINFWATWCPPCLKEIPEFIALQAQYKQQGLQFVGIAIDSQQAVSNYLKTVNVNYPMLVGGDEAIGLSQQLGNIVGTVPYSVIVDRQGRIAYRHPGELSKEKITEWLAVLTK